MEVKMYIKHKLTAYHWRYDHSAKATKMAICSCGWKSRFMRESPTLKLRRLVCLVRGHKWGDPWEAGFGPFDYDADDPDKPNPDAEWEMVQCDFCYLCKDATRA